MRLARRMLGSLIIVAAFSVIILVPQHVYALDQNGIITTPYSDNTPTIDGKWSNPNEWKDANVTTVGDVTNNGYYILAKHDRNYLYFMIDNPSAFSDIQKWGPDIWIDVNNIGGRELTNTDFRFYAGPEPNSSTNYGVDAQGTKINNPMGYNAAISSTSSNDPYESGRDHLVAEFQIPISFLHPSDSYGLSVDLTQLKIQNQKEIMVGYFWPENSHWGVPDTWGSLKAEKNTITAPPIPLISVSDKSLSFGNGQLSTQTTKSITITNTGTAALKIKSIQVPNEFSTSGTDIPISIAEGQSITLNVVFAPITLGDKSGSIIISSNDPAHSIMSIDVSGSGVEKSSTPFGGRCLIATAAFGSEIAPQVQFLREFRDNHILATADGSSFMTAFNAWYYSFSPYVADYERGQPWMQQIVRTSIYPLLGILTASEKAYSIVPGEYGSLSAGLVASSMIGAVYFWPFALTVPQVRKAESKFNYKLAAIVFSIVCVSAVISIIFGNQTVMVITTSMLVLTLVGIFAFVSAKTLVRISRKFSNSIGNLHQ